MEGASFLLDDLRYGYVSDDGGGPAIGDVFTFPCARPAICRKKTLTMFCLSCLCVSQFSQVLRAEQIGWAFLGS